MKDPKSDLTPAHHLNFALHTIVAAGVGVDMARHNFCLFSMPVFSVAVAAGIVQLQDSADNVSFADVDGARFVEPIDASSAVSRFMLVREQDVRRYVRIGIDPDGGSFNIGISSILLGSTQPPAAYSFSIDTSTL